MTASNMLKFKKCASPYNVRFLQSLRRAMPWAIGAAAALWCRARPGDWRCEGAVGKSSLKPCASSPAPRAIPAHPHAANSVVVVAWAAVCAALDERPAARVGLLARDSLPKVLSS